jgi:outer membrane protein TolC
MNMTKPDTTTVERFHMEAQAEFGQDAWPVWKPHSGGAWVQFQDHQNALRALATERDAALARAEQAEAEVKRLRAALTPSGDTKAAYMGEIKDPETKRHVSWTAIKMIMAMIAARSAPHRKGAKMADRPTPPPSPAQAGKPRE